MMYRYLLLLLTLSGLMGCKITGVYHFVHEETEPDRESLQWAKPDPHLTSQLTTRELPYLVVDFHSFWPGYSASAYLYVVQKGDVPIELISITVRSPETGEVYSSPLNVEASQKPLGENYRLYRYRVLNAGSEDRFSEADSLQVMLEWLDQNKVKRSITFDLIKKAKRDVGWPT